jgi:hypothetical protein
MYWYYLGQLQYELKLCMSTCVDLKNSIQIKAVDYFIYVNIWI